MAFLFKQSAQIISLQQEINQNNDLYEGRQRLVANRLTYYTGLDGDTALQAQARWERTPFYIYYPSIVSSFTSSIYKKPPHYVIPDEINVDNVDLLGNDIDQYTSQIPHQVLKQGFCATIIDYSDKLKRQFFRFIAPEQFVSTMVNNDNGFPELVRFIYTEMEERERDLNEFELVNTKITYVWDLVPIEINGRQTRQVRVRKYARKYIMMDQSEFNKKLEKTEQSDVLESEHFMNKNGKPLEALPIIIHGKNTNNYTVDRSVLQDISDLNINLITRVVDQVEVLHLSAIPTPYILGIDPADPSAPTTIGNSKLWVIGDSEAKVGLLEFSGASAQAHADYINELKQVMAVKGAQILRQQGVSRETATSVLIRSGQETAVITSIVQNISSQITKCIKMYAEYDKVETKDIEYKLNADFVNVDMEPNAQIALVRSWLDGAISHETVFNKMKEGEIITANRSFKDELEAIKKNPPPFFAKEVDENNAEDLEEKKAELAIKTTTDSATQTKIGGEGSGSGQEENLKGSNMETGNGIKNTEIKN